MTDDQEMHQRLTALESRLTQAEARLKDHIDHDHIATARELRDRYTALQAQVAAEELTAEAQGHHVTKLEHSLRMWLDNLTGHAT